MTAEQVQIRRDTAANLDAATPASGELGWDTTNKRLVGGDGATTGGIKIPNFSDVQKQSFGYATAGGTADVLTLALSPALLAYAAGVAVEFKAAATNTTAMTINVDTLGAKDIKKMSSGALAAMTAGDVVSGGIYRLHYDGTQFQIKGLNEGQAGGILQIAEALDSTYASGTTQIPYDDTIPQNSEGTEFTQAALAFTPASASSILIIEVWAWLLANNAASTNVAALFVGTTANALMAGATHQATSWQPSLVSFSHKVASGSISARTYKLRYGNQIGTVGINGSPQTATRRLGGVMKSGIRVTEILI